MHEIPPFRIKRGGGIFYVLSELGLPGGNNGDDLPSYGFASVPRHRRQAALSVIPEDCSPASTRGQSLLMRPVRLK